MKARLMLAAFCVGAAAILSLSVYAQQPTKTDVPKSTGEIATSEQQLARQFAEFQDLLMRLKQKLARGTPEEKKRAETLEKVLDVCKELAINQEFAKMIQFLRGANLGNSRDLDIAAQQSEELARRLAQVLELLRNSNLDLSKDRQDLEAFLKRLQKIIDQQETARLQTDLSKTDRDELQKIQEGVTKKTKELNQTIDKYLNKDRKDGADGKGGENAKGTDKDAGKGEGKKGEAKDAGKDGKGAQGEAKDAGAKDAKGQGAAKPGEDPKSAKSGDPKSGAKPGAESKESGAPKGSAKESKSGDPQGSAKESKGDTKAGGDAKGAGKKEGKEGSPQGNAKPGDPKKTGNDTAKAGTPDSKAKPGGEKGAPDSKAGAKENKGAPMAGDPKPGDAKPGDAKAGDAKPGDAKPGDAKAGDAKPGSPMAGAPPMAGDPKPGAKPGDAPPPPPSAGQPKSGDDAAKANKRIEEAGYPQVEAEKKISKNDNKAASDEQKKALEKLNLAKAELEKLLKQMREEEMERVLAALEARCTKMLQMQQRVLAGTIDVEGAINKNADKKADRQNKIASNKLSDDEKEIVQEANKCIDILKSEGSAVAFPEVFQQIRDDMIHVQNRLGLTDVGKTTQGIEQDIIDTLKEMIEALKKAQDDMKDSKPGKPGESKAGQPGDKKLLELIQELKMVRSLQKRINDRTVREGRSIPGEQANDPQVIRELRNLSERQLRLQEIIRRIANGDNK